MPALLDSFTDLPSGSGEIDITGGLVAAEDAERNLLVTSPNTTYIPDLPQGHVCVYMAADGTYGRFDPACWPQIYHPDFAYFAAVSKAVTSPHYGSAIWKRPTLSDFKLLEGIPVRNFGSLTDDFVRPLENLVAELGTLVMAHKSLFPSTTHTWLFHHQCIARHTCERLRHIPATLEDHQIHVSLLRRHWLLAMAYIRYANLEVVLESRTAVTTVAHELMGAWTSEPAVVQTLYQRGIPVWYVRDRVSVPSHPGSRVGFIMPPATYTVPMHGAPVYEGPVGYHSLLATQCTTQMYNDILRDPTACLCTPPMEPAQNTYPYSPTTLLSLDLPLPVSNLASMDPIAWLPAKKNLQRCSTSKARPGRDKFMDVDHHWMPPSISTWQRALSQVDRTGPAKPTADVWPYWVPEPALLISAKQPSKQLRFLMGWVRIRPIWLSLLPSRYHPTLVVNTQIWRNYLNKPPAETTTEHTANDSRRSHINRVFSGILPVDEIEPANGGNVDWHGYSFSEVPEELCPWILWEVHELAFRYELLALDRVCRRRAGMVEEMQAQDRIARVFAGQGLWSVTHLPAADERGLFAAVPHRRIYALNALRDVLVRWPGCPQPLKDVVTLSTIDSTTTVEAFEYWLATFYVRTFFSHAGRPPILPHLLPPLCRPGSLTTNDR